MKNVFTTSLFAAALAAAVPALAQTTTPANPAVTVGVGRLAGTVADSTSRKGLAFATVVLRPAATPQAPLSTMADERGGFQFAGIGAGEYTLEAHYLGYKTSRPVALTVAAAGPTLVVAVVLASDHQTLAEVKVTAAKPFIEQHANKLVLNVASSPLAAGGTAADVLSRAPGVVEDASGYSLRGKTVAVLLDGKLTNLRGDELKNLLASLPANTLDKVEIMANPSAKYDAQGGAVINLITTKNRQLGTNGTATAGVGVGRYGRYNAGLNLNHRTARLNVYGGYDRLSNQTYSTTSAVRQITAEVQLLEDGETIRQNQTNNLKLGLDYNLSKNTTMGVLVKGLLNYRTPTGSSSALLRDQNGATGQTVLVNTAGESRVLSPSVNLYYKTALDTLGKTLRVNADYFAYHKGWNNTYATRYFDGSGTPQQPAADLLRDTSPADNAVKAVSVDYAQPFYQGTLEAGLKTTATVTDNDIRWEQAVAGQPWTIDRGKTNHFIYRENIHAAYVTFAREFQKLSLQAGLRAEQTATTGTSLTLAQTTRRRYLNLFPSLSVQYNKSEKMQLGLSYRRAIDRFQFGIVNPFVTYISPYRYFKGNPAIQPSFSHNFELTHTYNSVLTTSLSYGHHTNVLIESYEKDAASQVVTSSYHNFRSAESLNGSITLVKPYFNNKWETMTTVGVAFAQVNAGAGRVGINTARPSALLSSNHVLTLPYGLKAEASVTYSSPMTFGGVAFRSSFVSSAGVSKTVLGKAGTLTLNVSDLFNTQQTRYQVLANAIDSRNSNKFESRFVKLNFSYKFGNKSVKASQRRETGVEAERRRMAE